MTFEFDRYINGTLMAEGVIIERQKNLADAMREAARIASRGPNGEAPVLVLRAEAAERALAERAGGVEVKALDEDDYEEITNAAGIAMRRASRGIRGQVITVQDSFDWWVMKETERRIRSALEPAAPEGRQDDAPVAWVRKWNFRGTPCADEFTDNADLAEQWRTHPQTNEVIPLYTRPAEQAVAWQHMPGCGEDRESKMVSVSEGAFCDPCIAPLVAALNTAGIETVASCCGHGHRPGVIVLRDGRELFIAKDFEEARKVDAAFPTDINGDARPAEQAVTEALSRIRDYADKPHADRYVIRNMAEDALKAAMEAGR